MKYGQVLHEHSIPQWMPYNVDYNELKHMIKVNTTRDQGQGITIPGQTDTSLQKFEDKFYWELCNQHDRVDLFVKSKADEFARKLRLYQRQTAGLVARCDVENGGRVTMKRREKFSRMESKILGCGEDIDNLERFVESQKTAFRKILKKYRKWTGSRTLESRFADDVLSSPKSFTKRDFEPLKEQYKSLITMLRTSSPNNSGDSTPNAGSRRESRAEGRRIAEVVAMEAEPAQPLRYWNEYDDGSEAGDENQPYTIYIDPNAESTFPGARTAEYVFSKIKSGTTGPISTIRGWISPTSTLVEHERRPLLGSSPSNGYFTSRPSSTLAGTETDIDDDVSSSEFPPGYASYHISFPSTSEQYLAQHREVLLFRGTIGSFVAAFLLLLVAAILVLTGRHRLRVEVDAGVTVGIVASLFFATLGFSISLCRWRLCGLLHRACVLVAFLAVCVLSGMLLVLVVGHNGL